MCRNHFVAYLEWMFKVKILFLVQLLNVTPLLLLYFQAVPEQYHHNFFWGVFSLFRSSEPQNLGPGLLPVPLPVFWIGVYAEFSYSPAIPVQQV